MPSTARHAGLCSNCKHAPTCTYPRDPSRPVLQCDEHRCVGSATGKTGGTDSLAAGAVQNGPEVQAEGPTSYMGLCSDCESRHTCVLATHEGGIWQCEEYR